jgi:hypothetical protein
MVVMISGSAGNHDWTLVGRDIFATGGDAGGRKEIDSLGFFCYFLIGREMGKVFWYEE